MYKLTIYVPSTYGTANQIDNEKYVRQISQMLSAIFGGCSVSKIDGYYVANDGSLVVESVTVVWTFGSDAEKLGRIGNYTGRWLKRVMRQESVLVTIERMEIVNFV